LRSQREELLAEMRPLQMEEGTCWSLFALRCLTDERFGPWARAIAFHLAADRQATAAIRLGLDRGSLVVAQKAIADNKVSESEYTALVKSLGSIHLSVSESYFLVGDRASAAEHLVQAERATFEHLVDSRYRSDLLRGVAVVKSWLAGRISGDGGRNG
jgi:hypothetical protein